MRDEIQTAWADETWPLSVAVCWIASRGDVSKLDDFEALETAANDLVQALKTELIVAHGVKIGTGDRFIEAVPKKQFRRAAPFTRDTPLEMIFGGKEFLDWRALTEADPEQGEGDRIASRYKTKWERLTVQKTDVRILWPRAMRSINSRSSKSNSPSANHARGTSDKIRSAKRSAATIYKRRAQEAGKLLFDGSKRETLRGIVLKAGASDDAAEALLRETEYAAALMPIDDELKPREAGDLLKKFVASARECACAWNALGADLRFSFNEPDLGADFYAAWFCAEELIKDIGSPTGLHSNSDYRYIHTIAELWERARLTPTWSGNESSGTKAKALFEQYICESVAPKDISNYAIRAVVEQFRSRKRVGEKSGADNKDFAP